MTVHLACSCAADAEYAPHSAAMLHSVLSHTDSVHVHYLTGPRFPAAAREAIDAMVRSLGGAIAFHEVDDERVAGLPTLDHAPASLWYRIFLPEMLAGLERVLYLDLDVIALESLAPLWETELDDDYLAAVTNVFMREHMGRGAMLGLAGDEVYFNSGVMLMNLAAWRRDGCTARVRDYAREHAGRLGWADQDAMNVLLGHRRVALHPRWNCMNSVLDFPWAVDVFGAEAVEEARRRPAIRHFEGPSVNKPWHYLCERAMRELYFEHRRRTPWPELELEGRTPRNVLRRLRRGLVRA
jgi:UDP-glucose/galactose:(glucosyl)LPS alpha-1,2-glucosyl/galactosyltransferase